MSEDFFIVPWYSSEEWHLACDYLHSDPPKLYEALNLLQLWKYRCPALPSAVESTLTLLQVYVQDNRLDNAPEDQVLRLAYSSAMMRFVNHMLDAETVKGNTLYRAAKNVGLPEWIVDMRHDTAHNNTLPSITLFREATVFSLEWLRNNYWKKQQNLIQDYVYGAQETNKYLENRIETIMHFCISLSFCSHSMSEIKSLDQIENSSMCESIINDANDIFKGDIDFSDLKNVTVSFLTDKLSSRSKKYLKGKSAQLYVNKALLGDESLFLSMELLNYIGGEYFKKNKKLPGQYVQCFKVLLTFLHRRAQLLHFIMGLIQITQSAESNHKTALLAALWVSEILNALNKSKFFREKMILSDAENTSGRTYKEIEAFYYHWFPSDRISGLALDWNKPVPEELMDLNFIQPIISSYNIYLTYFVKDLLDLVEPKLPNIVVDKVCELAKIISSTSESSEIPSCKVYTVDDLKLESDYLTENNVTEEYNRDKNCSQEFLDGIWKLASDKYNWGKCPIGQVPWSNDHSIETGD